MLRKIKLYGSLAKFIGKRVLTADVATAAEAVRMLVTNFPCLEQHMAKQHYRVTVGTYDLALDEIHDPVGQQEIKIIPVIVGEGGAGLKIALGALLIVGAFFTGGATIGLLGLAAPVAVSTVLGGIGVSLLIGGVAQLISPVPKVPQGSGSDNDPRKTFNFSGIQQTSRAGIPVPVVYGLTLVGSVVISAGTDTVQVKA
jgi:predicted phage tail protein